MKESTIEAKYVKAVKIAGGICIKLVAISFTGLPDRLTLMPGARIWFCEFKYGKGTLSARQRVVKEMLERLGFSVLVINELNVDEEIKCIQTV